MDYRLAPIMFAALGTVLALWGCNSADDPVRPSVVFVGDADVSTGTYVLRLFERRTCDELDLRAGQVDLVRTLAPDFEHGSGTIEEFRELDFLPREQASAVTIRLESPDGHLFALGCADARANELAASLEVTDSGLLGHRIHLVHGNFFTPEPRPLTLEIVDDQNEAIAGAWVSAGIDVPLQQSDARGLVQFDPAVHPNLNVQSNEDVRLYGRVGVSDERSPPDFCYMGALRSDTLPDGRIATRIAKSLLHTFALSPEGVDVFEIANFRHVAFWPRPGATNIAAGRTQDKTWLALAGPDSVTIGTWSPEAGFTHHAEPPLPDSPMVEFAFDRLVDDSGPARFIARGSSITTYVGPNFERDSESIDLASSQTAVLAHFSSRESRDLIQLEAEQVSLRRGVVGPPEPSTRGLVGDPNPLLAAARDTLFITGETGVWIRTLIGDSSEEDLIQNPGFAPTGLVAWRQNLEADRTTALLFPTRSSTLGARVNKTGSLVRLRPCTVGAVRDAIAYERDGTAEFLALSDDGTELFRGNPR